ncbi:MAG: biopolymer transporter ExbD [Spirochaetia bacterium]|nr:biopolymer transporter ExbD [Spirochaetia bacterium]
MVSYRKGSSQLFSGINIVPFTDVVLVLLIVFMVSAPGLLNTALNIRLPGATQGKQRQETHIDVGLDGAGKIYINNSPVERKDVEAKIKVLIKENGAEILLNADVGAKHGEVVELLDLLRSAGGNNVYIGTVRK